MNDRHPTDPSKLTQDELDEIALRRDAEMRAKAERGRDSGVSLDDFHAYMPMHSYIFAPTREMWPGASVNARIPPISVGVGAP
jgi:hypothetical protein